MDMNTLMDAACVPVIMIVVYIIIEALKKAISGEKFRNAIPLLCVIIGAVLGGLLFFFAPTMIPADNVVLAVIIGGMSGWAATGADQTVKRMMGGGNDGKT